MKYRFLDQIVGAFLVVTLILVIAALVLVGKGKAWFKGYTPYYAVFKEGYGLHPGSKVKMFNIDVGKVESVEIDEYNQVHVTLKVLDEYASRVRSDSKLTVEGAPIIGTSSLSLTPGQEASPLVEKGGRIASEDKKSVNDYLEYLETLRLEERFETLTSIMADVAEMTHRLKDPDGPLFGPLRETQALLAGLRQGQGTAGKILSDDSLYQHINTRVVELGPILSHVELASRDLAGMAGRLDETLSRVNTLTEQLSGILEPMKATVSQLPELTTDIRNTTSSLPALVEQVRNMLDEMTPMLGTARTMMRDAGQVVGALKNNPLIRVGMPEETPQSQMELDVRGVEP